MYAKKETFDKLTDNQLIALHKQGEMSAFDFVCERYKWLVRSICRSYFLLGGDNDDLLQEGFLGLLKAVNTYDETRNASFKTFATTCVLANVKTAVRKDSNMSNRALNESVSLTALNFTESENLEDLIIEKVGREETERQIKSVLSPLEYKILKLWLSGHSYREIAEKLGKACKSVDNAVQRIKKKLTLKG